MNQWLEGYIAAQKAAHDSIPLEQAGRLIEKLRLALKEDRLRQLSREVAQNRSTQKPSQMDSTIVNKARSEPEQIGLDTHIWED